MTADRDDRRHAPAASVSPSDVIPDTRSPAQKDRDRILYTSAYRRLAGVTQVVGAIEGHVFHNRLTHTGEVAQISRRLAERFASQHVDELEQRGLTLDPEVAEAGALAHDLGHPPFGHVAEEELNRLTATAGGYEGNAQSFRILTKLAHHRPRYAGLNLTRATLNAVLKYPWLRGDGDPRKPTKFGAYRTERTDYLFAREGYANRTLSLEAQVMDHADAVAYSVHDLDDFYSAGLIPLQEIVQDLPGHLERFRLVRKNGDELVERHKKELIRWFRVRFNRGRYVGDRVQRAALRELSADLIHDFVMEAKLTFQETGARLEIPPLRSIQIDFLQHLVWRYVIDSPRLASQQWGQRRVIQQLFETYREAIGDSKESERLVPGAFRQELRTLDDPPSDGAEDRAVRTLRLAADIVASFTDEQAVRLCRRLTGNDPGSVTELVDG